jgi:hypothetical protein
MSVAAVYASWMRVAFGSHSTSSAIGSRLSIYAQLKAHELTGLARLAHGTLSVSDLAGGRIWRIDARRPIEKPIVWADDLRVGDLIHTPTRGVT